MKRASLSNQVRIGTDIRKRDREGTSFDDLACGHDCPVTLDTGRVCTAHDYFPMTAPVLRCDTFLEMWRPGLPFSVAVDCLRKSLPGRQGGRYRLTNLSTRAAGSTVPGRGQGCSLKIVGPIPSRPKCCKNHGMEHLFLPVCMRHEYDTTRDQKSTLLYALLLRVCMFGSSPAVNGYCKHARSEGTLFGHDCQVSR